MTVLTLTAAVSLWLGLCAGIALAVWWSARHDATWEAEQPEAERPPLPQRIPGEFGAHPSVGRIVDRIVANEAARIAEEWKAMNS